MQSGKQPSTFLDFALLHPGYVLTHVACQWCAYLVDDIVDWSFRAGGDTEASKVLNYIYPFPKNKGSNEKRRGQNTIVCNVERVLSPSIIGYSLSASSLR